MRPSPLLRMERAVHRHHLHPVLLYTSPLPNHSQLKPENIGAHACLAMRSTLSLKTLPLSKTITVTRIQSQQTRPGGNRIHNKSMADEAPNKAPKQLQSPPTAVAGSEKLPPAAPEKPLPGDCCGSGCVRCVWDVYYEELEEYNKLYKSDSGPNSTKPS